jgi:hypothetical protein
MRKGQASNVGLVITMVVLVGLILLGGMVVLGFVGLRYYMRTESPKSQLMVLPTGKGLNPPGMGNAPPPQLVPQQPELVGKPAPEIEGEDVDGARFKLSDYRGKVVMLDFWGHW